MGMFLRVYDTNRVDGDSVDESDDGGLDSIMT